MPTTRPSSAARSGKSKARPRSRAKIQIDVELSGIRVPVSRRRVVDIVQTVLRAERVRDAIISVTFLSATDMTSLNRAHLGHRRPTDVISFELGRSLGRTIGDVYICPSVARDNAARAGITFAEELKRLLVHGTLHVLGYDHPVGRGRERSRMWQRQEVLVARHR
jgi:probable rRNA maturation factor